MTLLTAEQVAEQCQVKRRTIYNLVTLNKIPFVRVGGALRFVPDELETWLREHRRQQESRLQREVCQ